MGEAACEQSTIRVSFGDMATSGMSLPRLFQIVKGEAKNQDSGTKKISREVFVGHDA